LYLTIDTGHQTGQAKFLPPRHRQLKRAASRFGRSGQVGGLWLGTELAYDYFRQAAQAPARQRAACLRKVESDMDHNRHLFAAPQDADPYAWLEQLACYSPIIHLQQTDGSSSDHLPFTKECNRHGLIRPADVLNAIATSYARPAEPDMPPRCKEIYMTLEVFSYVRDTSVEILERLDESVCCWRSYIPSDGLALSELPCVKS